MSNNASTYELQITVARLLEFSYAKNGEMTASILREAGPVKLKVSDDGTATLSGQSGKVTYSASTVLSEVGVQIRRVGISMSVNDEGNLQYQARFWTGAITLNTRGTIDVEALLLTCSGMLCRAARALQKRTGLIEQKLDRALK